MYGTEPFECEGLYTPRLLLSRKNYRCVAVQRLSPPELLNDFVRILISPLDSLRTVYPTQPSPLGLTPGRPRPGHRLTPQARRPPPYRRAKAVSGQNIAGL